MKSREATKYVFPVLAKMGLALEANEGRSNSKSALLKDRANLRRMVNQLESSSASASADPEAYDRATDAITAAGVLIDEINTKLSWQEEDGAHDATGASGGRAVKDSSGRRIGTMLDAATLRSERAIAAALSKNRAVAYEDPAVAADERGTLTDFFRGVAGGKTTQGIRAALNEGTNTAGGYAVPTWLLPGILNALVPASSMLNAGANMVVLDDPGDHYTIAAVDTIPTPAWRLELATVASAGPTFRMVNIVPRDLAMIFQVSRELLADAEGMDQALSTVMSQAFAKEIDRAGLMGTGAAPEITGVLNAAGVQVYDMGTNGAQLTNYSPIVKARTLLANVNAPMPNAVITSTREAETFDLLADTLGQPLRRPPALESMQFESTSQITTTDTHGTATNASNMYLGKWNLATFYMREQLSIFKLDQLYAETGAIGFACHARLDLALAYPQAFAVIKGVTP
ncbi:MAG TPA: phage major capsid protein [Rhodanobacteraceae bacterium]|nr:phage major capsid protein [Rhodanobacteraceae bacterium]